jgi:putative peptidoglycan lipid II flippase
VRAERRWLVPASLIVVVALVLGIVGVIIGRTDVGHHLFGGTKPPTTSPSTPIQIERPLSLDPSGDGEHDEVLGNLIDGNPSTEWTTQTYDSPTFGTKSGVGVILPLAGATALGSLTVDSPSTGWKASVYVADAPSASFPPAAVWGTRVGTLDGPGTVSLRGRTGAAVLIWITNLGPARRVAIGEVHLRA